ncbi:MAG: hypothetical protein HY047_09275 [Acidobacteria bacterium]|nr:hypothetical protein [Acidobacteriota bacterium]
MTARVRPLMLFWISRSGVGNATVTWRRSPGETQYSLLIGSDPDRAPRRINRWGYIEEQVRGADASLIGLMTESDEDSIEDAEAGLRKQANGQHTFKVIRATINADQARSVVTTISTPEDYSFHKVRTVLELAERESSGGNPRVVPLPAGTRPGFLSALAELVHAGVESVHTSGRIRPAAAIAYIYHGKIYELRATRAQWLPELLVGTTHYGRVITTEFAITNTSSRETTRFSMSYGTDGPLAEIPITMTYRPRWWMQVDLALDDGTGPLVVAERTGQ